MSDKKLNIIDVTVSQGGFLVHNHVLKEQAARIAQGLEESGVEIMELSHGRGIGAKGAGYPGLFSDVELLEAARKAAPKLKFSAYVSPYPYSLSEVEKVAEHCEWFRLGVDLDDVAKGVDNLRGIRKAGGKAMAMLERAHGISADRAADAIPALIDAGAEAFYLTDTFSSMGPDEIKSYLESFRAKTSLPLGFQGFNATGRAIGNCLAASAAGAEWLDASLLGLGPSGGMPALEILAALAPQLGGNLKLDIQELCRAGEWYALPALRRLPSTREIDLALSKSKLDFYPTEFLEKLAGILEMDLEIMLRNLWAGKGDRLRLKESDLRSFLASQQIDFDVVVEFMKTGKVPLTEATP